MKTKRLAKRVTVFFLGIILVVVIGATKPSMAIGAETIELKFATHIPPSASALKGFVAWAKKVEELTDGRVKITVYPAGSLVKYQDQYPAVLAGVCDITSLHTPRVPDWSLSGVFDLPVLGWHNDNSLAIRHEVEKAIPQVAAQRSKVKTLWLYNSNMDVLHLVKKEVRVPDDMKGMKIISQPGQMKLIKDSGASPMAMPPLDRYMALQKGVADGTFFPYSVVTASKVDEATKIHLDIPTCISNAAVVMNLDKWNSLPADIKNKIEGTLAVQEKWQSGAAVKDEKDSRDKCIREGHTIITPSAHELALWQEKAKPAHQQWIKKMEAKNLPGKAVYDKLIEIINKYE